MKRGFEGTRWPWVRYETEHGEVFICGSGEYNKEYPICEIRQYPQFRYEVEANTQLITAAPELLGALQEMVEAYGNGVEVNCLGQLHDRTKAISSAILAIKKALGE